MYTKTSTLNDTFYRLHYTDNSSFLYWHKHFINTSQIRVFITEIYVEINTNFIRRFFVANAMTTLSNTKYCKMPFVWSSVPVIKCFSKGQNVNMLNTLHVHRRRIWTVSVGTHVPEKVPRSYTKRVCCKKCHPPWCDLNEMFLQWS